MRASLIVTLGIVATLIAVSTGEQSHRGELLPMSFAHIDHREQNCIECHHDFADDSGNGLCIDCHKRDPALDPLIEAQFHDLCRGCHIEQRSLGHDAGPTRACIDCHHTEDKP